MFDIIEPLECSVQGFTMQVAKNTRAKLADILPEVELDTTGLPVPTKDELKAMRDSGKELFATAERRNPYTLGGWHLDVMERVFSVNEMTDEIHSLILFVGTINCATALARRVDAAPYVYEGIISAAKAYAFLHGIKVDSNVKQSIMWALAWAPRGTTSGTDDFCAAVSGGYSQGFLYSLDIQVDGVLYEYGVPRPANHGSAQTMNGLLSTEGTDAVFHGFLSAENVFQLRWQSMRAGAAVKQVTGSDSRAKEAADTLRDVKQFTYKLYPNDTPFGTVYRSFDEEGAKGVGSCMSGDADDNRLPFDIHPCDVYSSSWFGAGDNGLVLVVAYKNSTIVGRGILNVNTEEIVRWYGEWAALVQFRKHTGVSDDGEALMDSWLALVEDEGKFVHPYVDGCYSSGDIEGSRVMLYSSGEHDLQYTRGYSHCEATYECCYDSEFYPESQMTHQPESGTHIADCNIHRATQCAVTGEYFDSYNTAMRTIDGERVRVWDGRAGNYDMERAGYTYLDSSIGWTKDEDQYQYDEVTGRYYTIEQYVELINERELKDDEDSDTIAA